VNSYGYLFKITLYGESHQDAIGAVLDGLPAGTKIDEELIKADLEKRKPKQIGTTPRKEDDKFRITSGVFNGYATGSPIHIMIENRNVNSKDYQHLKTHPRPGHADFVSQVKYKGFQDYRGGGRFSGRLTAAIVAAGSIAKMAMPFKFKHELIQVGTLKDMNKLDDYLLDVIRKGESVGGIIKLTVSDMIVGMGEPFFNKLDSELAQLLFSIPAVKGVEFGLGFNGVEYFGSQFNDVLLDNKGATKTNHSGGMTGGVSNGNDLTINVFVKPTSSIQKKQDTYNLETNHIEPLEINGRHDVAIVRRVGIVLENVVAIGLLNLYLMNKAYE
jgi:chorismate synthase